MKHTFTALTLGFSLLLASGGIGYTSAIALELNEEQEAQLGNLQHDATTCSMFYKLSAQGIRNRGNPDALKVAENTDELAEFLFETAFIISQIIGMKEEAMQARVRMSLESMMDDMENDFKNFSIVLYEHDKPFRRLVDTISTQVETILSK